MALAKFYSLYDRLDWLMGCGKSYVVSAHIPRTSAAQSVADDVNYAHMQDQLQLMPMHL